MSCRLHIRRTVVAMAMQAGIHPLSAMAWLHPETTAGQILALQVLAAERQNFR